MRTYQTYWKNEYCNDKQRVIFSWYKYILHTKTDVDTYSELNLRLTPYGKSSDYNDDFTHSTAEQNGITIKFTLQLIVYSAIKGFIANDYALSGFLTANSWHLTKNSVTHVNRTLFTGATEVNYQSAKEKDKVNREHTRESVRTSYREWKSRSVRSGLRCRSGYVTS